MFRLSIVSGMSECSIRGTVFRVLWLNVQKKKWRWWWSTLTLVHVGKMRGGMWKGIMEEFESRRRGMLITGEWCDPVSKIWHHMKKGVEWLGDWAWQVWVWRQHFDQTSAVSPALECRGTTRGQLYPTPYTRCHWDLSPFSPSYDT